MTINAKLPVTDKDLRLISDALLTELCRVSREEGRHCERAEQIKALHLAVCARLEQCELSDLLAR